MRDYTGVHPDGGLIQLCKTEKICSFIISDGLFSEEESRQFHTVIDDSCLIENFLVNKMPIVCSCIKDQLSNDRVNTPTTTDRTQCCDEQSTDTDTIPSELK